MPLSASGAFAARACATCRARNVGLCAGVRRPDYAQAAGWANHRPRRLRLAHPLAAGPSRLALSAKLDRPIVGERGPAGSMARGVSLGIVAEWWLKPPEQSAAGADGFTPYRGF